MNTLSYEDIFEGNFIFFPVDNFKTKIQFIDYLEIEVHNALVRVPKLRAKAKKMIFKHKGAYESYYRKCAERQKKSRRQPKNGIEYQSLITDYVWSLVGNYTTKKVMEYVLKLVEDILILVHNLIESTKWNVVVVSIITFIKLRSPKSIITSIMDSEPIKYILDLFKDIRVNCITQSEDQPIESDNVEYYLRGARGMLDNFDLVKNSFIVKKIRKCINYLLSFALTESAKEKLNPEIFEAMDIEIDQKVSMKHYPDFIYCILDTLTFICERSYQAIKIGKWTALFHSSSTYQKWYEECEEIFLQEKFLGDPVTHKIDIHKYTADIHRLIDQGECIYQNSKRAIRSDPYMVSAVSRNLGRLKLARGNYLTTEAAQQERRAPLGILVDGCSSIGKSTFCKILFYHYGKYFNKPVDDRYRYVRMPSIDFWDGFDSSQYTIHIDDAACFKANICTDGDKSVQELLQIINQVPMCPNQAALENKGKTPLRPDLVTCSTNTYHLNVHEYYECPLAVMRRFKMIIHLVPKAEYRKDGMLNSSLCIDLDKDCYPDYWDIYVYRVKPLISNENSFRLHQSCKYEQAYAFSNMVDFLCYYNSLIKEHTRDQTQVMESMKVMRELQYCDGCKLPKTHCKCNSPLYTGITDFKPIEVDVPPNEHRSAAIQGNEVGIEQPFYIPRDVTFQSVNIHRSQPVVLIETLFNPEYFFELHESFTSMGYHVINTLYIDDTNQDFITHLDEFRLIMKKESQIKDRKSKIIWSNSYGRKQCLERFYILYFDRLRSILNNLESRQVTAITDMTITPLKFFMDTQSLTCHCIGIECFNLFRNPESKFLVSSIESSLNFVLRSKYPQSDISDCKTTWVLSFDEAYEMVVECINDCDDEVHPEQNTFRAQLFNFTYYPYLWVTDKVPVLRLFKFPVPRKFQRSADMLKLKFIGAKMSSYFPNHKLLIQIAVALSAAGFIAVIYRMISSTFFKSDIKKQSKIEELGKHIEPNKNNERCNVWYKQTVCLTPDDVPPASRSMVGRSDLEVATIFSRNVYKVRIARYLKSDPQNSLYQSEAILTGICGFYYVINKHSLEPFFNHPEDMFEMEIYGYDNKSGLNDTFKFQIYKEAIVRTIGDITIIKIIQRPPVYDLTKFIGDMQMGLFFDGYYIVMDSNKEFTLNPVRNISIISSPIPGERSCYEGKALYKTEAGQSGSLLVANSEYGPIILGIHSYARTGDQFVVGSSILDAHIVITIKEHSEMPIMSDNKIALHTKKLGPLYGGSAIRNVPSGTANVYGTIINNYQMSYKSRVSHTPLYKILKEQGYKCKWVAPPLSSPVPFRRALISQAEQSTNAPEHLFNHIYNHYVNDVFLRIDQDNAKTYYGMMTLEQAINGVPGIAFLDGINRNSSSGFPHNKSKKNFLIPDISEDYPNGVRIDNVIKEEIQAMIDCYNTGLRYKNVYTASLKDEPITEQKAEIFKVRVFTGAPMAQTLLGRMVLLPLIKVIQENRFAFECMVGTVTCSSDWTQIGKYLNKFDGCCIAGDFKEYDKKMFATLILGAGRAIVFIIQRLYKLKGEVAPQEHINIVYGLFVDIAFSCLSFRGDIIEFMGGNPSGVLVTVIVNSLCNSALMRFAYMSNNPDGDLISFASNVNLATYGDDNCMGVNKIKVPWFTHKNISRTLKQIGITYTPADKSTDEIDYTPFSELSFLKRTWVWNDELNEYMCPLEEESIIKSLMIHVRSKSITPAMQVFYALSGANDEYFFYGKTIYEQKRVWIRNLVHELDLDRFYSNILFPNYDELVARFKRLSKGTRPYIDQSIEVQAKHTIIRTVQTELNTASIRPVPECMCDDCTTIRAIDELFYSDDEWRLSPRHGTNPTTPKSLEVRTVVDEEKSEQTPSIGNSYLMQYAILIASAQDISHIEVDALCIINDLNKKSHRIFNTTINLSDMNISVDAMQHLKNLLKWTSLPRDYIVDEVSVTNAINALGELPSKCNESLILRSNYVRILIIFLSHTDILRYSGDLIYLASQYVKLRTTADITPYCSDIENHEHCDEKIQFQSEELAMPQSRTMAATAASMAYAAATMPGAIDLATGIGSAMGGAIADIADYVTSDKNGPVKSNNPGGSVMNSQPTAVRHQITEFHNETGGETQQLATVNSYTADHEGKALKDALANFMERPKKIIKFVYDSVSSPGTAYEFDVWDLILGDNDYLNKMKTYGFIRGKMVIEARVNSTPFNFGHVIMTYRPYSTNKSIPNGLQYATVRTQRKCVDVFPQDNAGGTMEIPFFYSYKSMEITGTYSDLGTLAIMPMVALRTSNGSPSPSVDIVVYAMLKDVEFIGDTIATQSTVETLSKGDRRNLDAYTSALGKMRLSTLPALANGDVDKQPVNLTISSGANVLTDPSYGGSEAIDETNINYICKKQAFLTYVDVAMNQAVETSILQGLVHPGAANRVTLSQGRNVITTPVGYISSFFRYWRGDLVYHFKFIKSAYHKGRFRLTYDPRSVNGPSDSDHHVRQTYIIDIGEVDSFDLRTPFTSKRTWLPNYRLTDFDATNLTGNPPSTTFSSAVHCGVWTLSLETPLTAPGTSDALRVEVYIRAADNFEVAEPIDVSQNVWLNAPYVFQSTQEELVGSKVNTDESINGHFGDKFVSLRQLAHRMTYFRTIPVGTSATNGIISSFVTHNGIPWARGLYRDTFVASGTSNITATGFTDYTGTNYREAVITPYVAWFNAMFCGFRGSMIWSTKSRTPSIIPDNTIRSTSSRFLTGSKVQAISTINATTSDDVEVELNDWGVDAYLRASMCGTELSQTITQPYATVTSPNYNPVRFYTVDSRYRDGRVDDFSRARGLIHNDVSFVETADGVGSNNNVYTLYTQYVGAGSDWTPMYWLNTPIVYYYTG